MDVFETTPPHCALRPERLATGPRPPTTDCTLAVCTAPGQAGHPAAPHRPGRHHARPPAARAPTPATSTPSPWRSATSPTRSSSPRSSPPPGHWSSYPSHRHDEDDFPRMTYLEETYYHRLNPARRLRPPAGLHRGRRRSTRPWRSRDDDVVLVPRGHHPCGAPYGFELYYLNVMAGPLRKWRFVTTPTSSGSDSATLAERRPSRTQRQGTNR